MAAPILLLGEGDLADEVRAALDALDAEVVRLVEPTQREVAEVFERGPDRARGRRLRATTRSRCAARSWCATPTPDVELLVTYFDPATAERAVRADRQLPDRLDGRHRRADARRAVPGRVARRARGRGRPADRAAHRRRRGRGGRGRRARAHAARARCSQRAAHARTTRARRCCSTARSAWSAILLDRDGRGGDRAAAEPRRRVLRRGEDARHRRPERQGRRRAGVVQDVRRGAHARSRWSSRRSSPPASSTA